MNRLHTSTGMIALFVLGTGVAHGALVDGTYADTPRCDDHGNRFATEEFGDPSVFHDDESILHASTFTQDTACPLSDDPTVPNAMVEIINLTNRTLRDLFYVGDPDTSFSNEDGVADAGVIPGVTGQAFRIDSVGANRPLVFESVVADGILQPGEVWLLIVQDYSNAAGLPADAFFSIGFADASAAVIQDSSASIVQFIPSPGGATTLALAGLLAMARRRRD